MLANARLDVGRYTSLVEKNYISRQQLDASRSLVAQYEAAVKGDQAAIHNAQIQLGYTAIRSPIDGRVGIRQIDMGNILHAAGSGGNADTVVVVTQLRPISVIFTLNQEELPHLSQIKGKADVSVLSRDGGQPLDQGQLAVIDNQIDPSTSTVRLKAVFPNANGTLWPGQFVSARVLLEKRTGVVTVPATSVQQSDKGPFVYVVKDGGQVEIRPVTIGAAADNQVEVIKGIAEGEVVVSSGQYRIKPDSRVAVTLTQRE